MLNFKIKLICEKWTSNYSTKKNGKKWNTKIIIFYYISIQSSVTIELNILLNPKNSWSSTIDFVLKFTIDTI